MLVLKINAAFSVL